SHNEKPYALSFFPAATKAISTGAAVLLQGKAVVISAFKKAEASNNFIIRLNETTGLPQETVLKLPDLEIEKNIAFGGFEIRSFLVITEGRAIVEVDLMEKPLTSF
ncbi:MAG TPA: glycosyl hydrolase-related protein, partial [Candidatus Paceibacterota bacterium]